MTNEPPGARRTNRSIILYPPICTMSSRVSIPIVVGGDITEKHSLRSMPASQQTAYDPVPVIMVRRRRVTQFPEGSRSVPVCVTAIPVDQHIAGAKCARVHIYRPGASDDSVAYLGQVGSELQISHVAWRSQRSQHFLAGTTLGQSRLQAETH